MREKKERNKPNKQQEFDWHCELVVHDSRDQVTEPMLEKIAIEMTSKSVPGIGDIIAVEGLIITEK